MANIPEDDTFDEGVYQFETTDPVEGGPNGVDNLPHKQLANRTQYLKKFADEVTAARGNAESLAARLIEQQTAIDVLESVVDPGYSSAAVSYAAPVSTDVVQDAPVFAVVSAVTGDDSIDVTDTSGITVGQHMVIRDGATFESIQVFQVLSGTRITATQVLTHTYGAGATLSRWDDAIVFLEETAFRLARVVVEGVGAFVVSYFADGSWVPAESATDAIGGRLVRGGPSRIKVDITSGSIDRVVVVSMPVINDESVVGAAYRIIALDGMLATEEV